MPKTVLIVDDNAVVRQALFGVSVPGIAILVFSSFALFLRKYFAATSDWRFPLTLE
jgi:hypothetical protein